MVDTLRISIVNGRLIDPANDVDQIQDLHIAAGRVLALGEPPAGFQPDLTLDATNQIVCPGLIDLCVHLREPGLEHKGTIASETAAAAKGGITTLCCPPETDPVIDTPAVVELIRQRAAQESLARVFPMGALTQDLQGEQLSEMAALKAAGCRIVCNGSVPLKSTLVQRRAMEYASSFDLTVFLLPADYHLSNNGCAHEGVVATRLGLPGIPTAAETVAVARDLALAEQTGARIHFRGLSAGTSANMVGRARYDRIPVTADINIHQLHLTETDVDGFNSNCHVLPPLRTLADREALRQALASGVISAVCSDHQPHEADAKQVPFPSAAPGVSGLEVLLPLTLKLVTEGVMPLMTALARLTQGPAQVLGLPLGQLGIGDTADICIFDPEARWELTEASLVSRGHNTPFLGWEMNGQVTYTLLEGRIVYQRDNE